MRNTFGNVISVTLFGESHGEVMGAVLDGLTAGIKIDEDNISKRLAMRKPVSDISTSRVEDDEVRIVSGVFCGVSTGAPITVLIENKNTVSKDYSLFKTQPRPSHADYVAGIKYGGYQDFRGGGHFSGRLTAPLVAAGAILESALNSKGIYIGTHIKNLHGVLDRDFSDYEADINLLNAKVFPALSPEGEEKMKDEILRAKQNGDSVGGILESAVIGLPAVVGEPWFDSLESMLSHAIFSIPGIKGIEFGLGFGFSEKYGSEANDPFVTDGEKIFTKTNNSGGINGGISNGMPIVFSCAVKPTSSIARKQKTVNFINKTETEIEIQGRHDATIIPRACVVAETLSAIVIADLLIGRYGTDYLLNK
jgi:chorismate synthase